MKRLLIVDDDPEIRDGLSMILEDTYEVVCARDGLEALERISAQRFDAVLLDLMMPVLDGVGVVRELEARGIHLPIILVSASGSVAERARQLAVTDYVSKPFSVESIEAKLASVLGQGSGGTGGEPGGSSRGPLGSGGGGGSGPLGTLASWLRMWWAPVGSSYATLRLHRPWRPIGER